MDEKLIALTFDDGPNTTTTAQVIDKLEKYGVIASFFIVGDNINEASAQAVKRAHAMGCEICNHSRTHTDMTKLTSERIREEFRYTDGKIAELTGERSGFFRPPYIAVDRRVFDNIDVPFIAGIGCNDWDEKITAAKRASMIIKQAEDGSIILLHDSDGNSKTVEALDIIIPRLLESKFRFVTVSALFAEKGIEPERGKVYSNIFQTSMYG